MLVIKGGTIILGNITNECSWHTMSPLFYVHENTSLLTNNILNYFRNALIFTSNNLLYVILAPIEHFTA